jgi:prevent-host-death family protein
MKRIDLTEGIIPLSKFRARAAECVMRVKETRRPIVITQHGQSASVLMAVGDYEELMDRAELVRDVEKAERQLELGYGVPHTQAKKRLLAKVRV